MTEDTAVAVAESTMVLSEHQQALRRRRRAHRRLPRHPPRRGARPARRERRRQVDADGCRLRARPSPTAARSPCTASSSTRCRPAVATQLGIAIVHQHPAVLPDMTVAENIRVAVPASSSSAPRGPARRRCGRCSTTSARRAHLEDRVGSLTVAQKHLLELAKALVVKPTLLILDEPTAPLGADAVDLLFDRVREAAATRHRRRLHHPPARRGARARRPGHRAARRQAARHAPGRRHHRRRAAGPHRRAPARLDLPAQADRRRRTTTPLLVVDGPDGARLLRRLLRRRAAARSSASPASSATARATLLRALAGLESFDGHRHGRRTGSTSRKELRERSAYLPPTGTARA